MTESGFRRPVNHPVFGETAWWNLGEDILQCRIWQDSSRAEAFGEESLSSLGHGVVRGVISPAVPSFHDCLVVLR
jgi:hypothetical protein